MLINLSPHSARKSSDTCSAVSKADFCAEIARPACCMHGRGQQLCQTSIARDGWSSARDDEDYSHFFSTSGLFTMFAMSDDVMAELVKNAQAFETTQDGYVTKVRVLLDVTEGLLEGRQTAFGEEPVETLALMRRTAATDDNLVVSLPPLATVDDVAHEFGAYVDLWQLSTRTDNAILPATLAFLSRALSILDGPVMLCGREVCSFLRYSSRSILTRHCRSLKWPLSTFLPAGSDLKTCLTRSTRPIRGSCNKWTVQT